ncbi:GNAT family N-acetyltransferase [Halodurantibacterium flavum]|uniref:GNAT family N-acetyltransferase n=1 Tax=Halodurantibacterium flavum TaxID=1382802 RepID=A0ABW4S442_9RHOB
MIRPATPADGAAVAELWNPVIRDTLVTFTTQLHAAGDVERMIAGKQEAGLPFLVAQAGDAVLGFASYGPFRNGPGYRYTMEHTVILAPEGRGRGIGRAIMQRLEDHARTGGVHSLIGGISAANPAGRAFHAALGYLEVAVLPEVGYKWGQWLDLVLMQKKL